MVKFTSDLFYNKPAYWLTFSGLSGTGKTYLATLVWQWYLRCGQYELNDAGDILSVRDGYYAHWPTLRRKLANRDWGMLDSLVDKHLLIMDEIRESGEKTDVFREALSDLISCRMGRWTILTCNLSLDQIGKQIDTRISSRIVRDSNVLINFNCQDFSMRK